MSNFPIKEKEIGKDSVLGIGEKAYIAGRNSWWQFLMIL